MPQIFVSHVEEDAALADEFVRALEHAGYTTWHYRRDSALGQPYTDTVARAIADASVVLLILSPDALASSEIDREIHTAHLEDRPILPVLTELSENDLKREKPGWRYILGPAVFVCVPRHEAIDTAPAVLRGLRELGIEPAMKETSKHAEDRTNPLEALTRDTAVRGLAPDGIATIVSTESFGSDVLSVTYRDATGAVADQLVYRRQPPWLEIAESGRPWSFDGDGALLRLVSEAQRIHLAYLFDPLLAVHSSIVEPLPHQITAVYEEMLQRQPLRYLLADDPGAGKTIMTGLFIKELVMRGDLERCLIVCPGSLTEQWEDELSRKFGLDFRIITSDLVKTSRTGNPFAEHNLCIARLDHLARNPELQEKVGAIDWDLIVCDEAHKMAAHYFGGELKITKRYELGRMLSEHCRHFLLLSATPHNGKEEDFQAFMALLDGDRFEGKFRDGVHQTDASDLMRRLVKEDLLKFDGTPLFPERRAYTVTYDLSGGEARLYDEVTEYVREEMNRAERLAKEGEKRRGNTVGFALTILQRRLASSPEAIYRSLERRRKRLESRLNELELRGRGREHAGRVEPLAVENDPLRLVRDGKELYLTEDDLAELDDLAESEVEELEQQVALQATAARTIDELRKEIASLKRLEQLAYEVRQSETDRKWEELRNILLHTAEMFDAHGARRKLIIFTEHKDTLNYLRDRIVTLLGDSNAVVTIHGSMAREARRDAQERFTHDPDALILIATDAAGEGVNLQRAHLMVNYDLPWNPNRLEQRFGRIHRIGQTEVCHLWNLVAPETREGDVFKQLFEKLEEEREALGGKVFDVLGRVFENRPLRELLIEAIRYGDRPEVRKRLEQQVGSAMNRERLRQLLEERALARESMDARTVQRVREDMERAEARRLQPHFIASFFLEAFRELGGTVREREPGRYEITHVPLAIRRRDRQSGAGAAVQPKYERVTFQKELIAPPGRPLAAFLCPGHPLLDAVIDLMLERHRDLLKRGAVLVDPDDPGTEPRALIYLEHSIHDGRLTRNGQPRVISRRLEFVEMTLSGEMRNAGYAPYLDYRPISPEERDIADSLIEPWTGANLENRAVAYAVQHIIPPHLAEVKRNREARIRATAAAVQERLTREIVYWDNRAVVLEEQERAGKQPRLNSLNARRRATELEDRLNRRLAELEAERKIAAMRPVVIGGSLIIPAGALPIPRSTSTPDSRRAIELAAMQAVMDAERRLGRLPRDVSAQHVGYDVESRTEDGRLVLIEVKGRKEGAETVTLTRNEILTALNIPDDFVLALVEIDGTAHEPRYVRRPPFREPSFAEVSVNFDLDELLALAEEPR